MLRDRSLVPLSHQHHNALALCVLTDRSLEADASPANVERLAARIVDRYEIEMVNHFELEENVLFPRLHGLEALVERLIAEHRQITALVDRIRIAPAADLLTAFTQALHRHIRIEENELFQEAQRLLPREVLNDIGRTIDARAVRVCL